MHVYRPKLYFFESSVSSVFWRSRFYASRGFLRHHGWLLFWNVDGQRWDTSSLVNLFYISVYFKKLSLRTNWVKRTAWPINSRTHQGTARARIKLRLSSCQVYLPTQRTSNSNLEYWLSSTDVVKSSRSFSDPFWFGLLLTAFFIIQV